jgi:hypothetical protein
MRIDRGEAPRSHHIDGQVVSDSDKPRPHRAPSGIVRFGVPPGALERSLGDVFSQSLVAGNLVGGAENGPLEPPDERTRELGLAGR